MTKGEQFAKTMRYTLSIGTRTRRHAADRDLHTEILNAISETNLYPGCRSQETEAIFRTAYGAWMSYQKHVAGYRLDGQLIAHINAMSPWQFCNLLGRMIDAEVTNTGEGERFLAELHAELFAPATETQKEETNVTEYGIFEDGACIEAGFHGEAGQASAQEHAGSLVAAHPEMADAYEVLEMCPDHEEQAKRDCEECATDSDGDDDLGPGFCMTCSETFESHEDLNAHQEETGHEMEQPDHRLRNSGDKDDYTPSREASLHAARVALAEMPGKWRDDPAYWVGRLGQALEDVMHHVDTPAAADEVATETAPAEPRYVVQRLGSAHFAVLDNVTSRHVFSALDDVTTAWPAPVRRKHVAAQRAQDKADQLNAAADEPAPETASVQQTGPERRPYDAKHVQMVDMGHTVWALYIPDPEQAKDPQHVADNLLRREYADVEVVATARRFYKKEGAHFSGWVVEAPGGGNSDGIPNKRQAMQCLRLAIRDHFAR
jgi:hypothetical protein